MNTQVLRRLVLLGAGVASLTWGKTNEVYEQLSDGSLWNVRGRSSASYPALVYDEAALFA